MVTAVRASFLPSYNDCPRRTVVSEMLTEELTKAGYKLKRSRVSAAAAVGTALHAGAYAYLLDKLNGIGSGGAALDVAISAFRAEIRDGAEYDAISPTGNDAEKQIGRMLIVYKHQLLPSIEPANVERYFELIIGPDWLLTGHPDVHTTRAQVRDLKSISREGWPAGVQLGAYALLCQAHGHEVRDVLIDYVERTPLKKPQAPAETVPYNLADVRKQAILTLRWIQRDVNEYRRTGDIEHIPTNPLSQFCKRKFCPAYGTDACRSWQK